MEKILIVTGGTGGHVLPAVEFYDYLKNKGYNTSLACDTRGSKYSKHGIQYQWNSYGKNFITRWLKIILYFFKALFIVKNYNKIVVFGTYHSVSFILAGYILKIPIYSHEQNIILSRVNTLFYPLFTKLLVSWATNYEKKTFYSGMPIRSWNENSKISYENINTIIDVDKIINKFTIIISLGSQEAPLLKPWLLKIFQNIHPDILSKITIITSKNNWFINESLPMNVEYFTPSFHNAIMDLYNISSMAIGRGGASFLYEMAVLNKPIITLPLKNSVNNHQYYNSKYFCDHGLGCLIVQENELIKASKFIEEIYRQWIENFNNFSHKNLIYPWVIHNSCQLMESIINQ